MKVVSRGSSVANAVLVFKKRGGEGIASWSYAVVGSILFLILIAVVTKSNFKNGLEEIWQEQLVPVQSGGHPWHVWRKEKDQTMEHFILARLLISSHTPFASEIWEACWKAVGSC